ncbi:DUF3293 domain-containing protein [Thalassotalea sp. PS06]|uniref:DUF3293 domain-containing protein n=1 Tax=Thalassotalea sp. PS06 TaxID=2594005 RepID=UPI001162DC21|nr:DUF3293 domain-containing protein [Thalassotalea sp. PS06]QDP01630.1 DUF3293 domain-containing protein [Thalassotalea sp. PS06]
MSKQLSPQLMKIYQDTLYQVTINNETFPIELGESEGALHLWLQQQGVYAAALISAYNPYSEKLSEEENLKADNNLQSELKETGYQFHCGQGQSPSGDWIEPSVLVLNIDRRNACLLAQKYRQNAFVFLFSTPSHTLSEIVVSEE